MFLLFLFCTTKIGEISDIAKCFENFVSQTLGFLTSFYAAELRVDVDKNDITASQYRIQSVPTLMLFRNGEVLWRTSGVVEKTELLATLDPFLK